MGVRPVQRLSIVFMRTKETLLQKIEDKSAKVGVVGLGYVGLPFAVEKAKVGYSVLGIEMSQERCDAVNRGDNYIPDVDDRELRALTSEGRIRAQTTFDDAEELDVIVIAVPTPLTHNLAPDLQYVRNVTQEIAKRLQPHQLISLESTTYPGTTEEVMKPILERGGLKTDADFYLAHSPERVDPGNKRYSTKNTSKVVGGAGPNSLEVAVSFYRQTIEKIAPVSSARAAEMVKVFENTFRAVNIALVNELALLCDRMNLNVWEVLDAAFTKPFGIMPFYPGPGVGGHCIPIDPHYLEWKAKEFNFNTHFIALAGEINRKMPEFVRDKAQRVLNRLGVAPSKARVLVVGMAYKRDLGDWRESPAYEVFRLMLKDGARVDYHDDYVPCIEVDGVEHRSRPLEALETYDLAIIATDHSYINWTDLVRQSRAVLDTRNATRQVTENRERIALL